MKTYLRNATAIKAKQPKVPSQGEETLALHLRCAGLPAVAREHRFHPTRQWRFDFAWPDLKVAVEVEGGIGINGRHTRPGGFRGDMEKYNAAVELGWVVLRYDLRMIKSGHAVRQIESAIEHRSKSC